MQRQYITRLRTLEDAVPAERDPLFARRAVERALRRPADQAAPRPA